MDVKRYRAPWKVEIQSIQTQCLLVVCFAVRSTSSLSAYVRCGSVDPLVMTAVGVHGEFRGMCRVFGNNRHRLSGTTAAILGSPSSCASITLPMALLRFYRWHPDSSGVCSFSYCCVPV